jgi:hypothetical protein
MSVLCFDENTTIKNNSGDTISMKYLKLGDVLDKNNLVTSVYRIDGKNVEMYLLGKTKVSGGHKVWFKNKYIPVSQHPDAISTSESTNLVCINTKNRMFKIESYEFLDFAEGGEVNGLPENTIISLKTVDVPLSKVVVGDVLINNDIIIGVVKHLINNKIMYNLITKESIRLPEIEILN